MTTGKHDKKRVLVSVGFVLLSGLVGAVAEGPHVVAVPPAAAVRDLCRTADGEIRHYGWKTVGGERRRVYVASRDEGANWTFRVAAFSDVRCEDGACYRAAVALSDDDGDTWRYVPVQPLKDVPRFGPGDRRPRWFNDGCEPSVVERNDGSLLMALRTSGGHHAFCESRDGGETWSEPQENPAFWATNTMPLLFRLKDGRLLFVWNNTAQLPTRDAAEYPELSTGERAGVWETVFTNRDALHAAISDDDGRTWRGFREIALTEPRNAADFRELGNDPDDEHDKSVHCTRRRRSNCATARCWSPTDRTRRRGGLRGSTPTGCSRRRGLPADADRPLDQSVRRVQPAARAGVVDGHAGDVGRGVAHAARHVGRRDRARRADLRRAHTRHGDRPGDAAVRALLPPSPDAGRGSRREGDLLPLLPRGRYAAS